MKIESSDGTILFDREEGHAVSARGSFRVKGENMTFSYKGMELPGAVDFTIESATDLLPEPKN